MAHVFATDKPAKARGEAHKYHVEQVAGKEMAEDTVAHIVPKVDPDRWEITWEFYRSGTEPPWDAKAHMNREAANVPGAGVDAESVTPRPHGPVTLTMGAR